MMARQNIWYAFAIVVVMTLLLFSFFKVGKVPDVVWKKSYNTESKDAYGLWLFNELLKENFGDSNVITDYHFTSNKYSDTNFIYLAIGNSLNFSEDESYEIESFIADGHDAILISNNINFSGDDLFISSEAYVTFSEKDTFAYMDSLKSSFVFKHYFDGFDSTKLMLSGLPWIDQDTVESEDLMICKGSRVFYRYAYGDGELYIHALPELFSNIASKQSFYTDHFNEVIPRLRGKRVIISMPSGADIEDESPLKTLLSWRSMRAAYYTLLASMLIYVVFGSRRIQKPIKVIEKLENTTMEYVGTLSRLYLTQGQNHQLVKKMKNNFLNYASKHFYLNPNDSDFPDQLSRKTKVNPVLIKSILATFDSIEQSKSCTDDQLLNLYKNIDNFKKQSNYGR